MSLQTIPQSWLLQKLLPQTKIGHPDQLQGLQAVGHAHRLVHNKKPSKILLVLVLVLVLEILQEGFPSPDGSPSKRPPMS
jgi:hypothetical protein